MGVYSFGVNYRVQLGVCDIPSFTSGLINFAKSWFGYGAQENTEVIKFTHIPQKVNFPVITQVACGTGFTVCLSADGEVFTFGDNRNGQLGHGNKVVCGLPAKIESLSNIEFVSCGGFHTICKSFENDIYVWGYNGAGQLGTGNTINLKHPVKATNWPENIVEIKSGDYHTLVLTENREVFSCGDNSYGKLGRPTLESFSPNFEKISSLSNIIFIECATSVFYSMCVDVNHDLYVFGLYNDDGDDGEFEEIGMYSPKKHQSLSNITDISKGINHIFFKTSGNQIFATGYNEHSQLGKRTPNLAKCEPIQVFQGKEDIWCSINNKPTKAKSARSILPRPSNEHDNSPPKKKQKTK